MAENHLPVVNNAAEGDASATDQRYNKTTLAELGSQLPVGIRTAPGSLDKTLVVRPWKTKDEREIARLKKPDTSIAKYVALIIGTMCERIGPHDLAQMKPAERELIISQMYLGDVFYAYCYLRRMVMGSKLKVEFDCAHCKERIPYVANLDTLEVNTVEREEQLGWSVDLQDPIKIRSKEIRRFRLSAIRWSTLENTAMVNAGSDAVAKIAAVRGSIVGLNDDPEPVMISDLEMDELSKFDLENLAHEVNINNVGPVMAIEDECTPEFCPRGGGRKFTVAIDWSYDSFFGISSR